MRPHTSEIPRADESRRCPTAWPLGMLLLSQMGRFVTGANPASAHVTAEEAVKAFDKLSIMIKTSSWLKGTVLTKYRSHSFEVLPCHIQIFSSSGEYLTSST